MIQSYKWNTKGNHVTIKTSGTPFAILHYHHHLCLDLWLFPVLMWIIYFHLMAWSLAFCLVKSFFWSLLFKTLPYVFFGPTPCSSSHTTHAYALLYPDLLLQFLYMPTSHSPCMHNRVSTFDTKLRFGFTHDFLSFTLTLHISLTVQSLQVEGKKLERNVKATHIIVTWCFNVILSTKYQCASWNWNELLTFAHSEYSPYLLLPMDFMTVNNAWIAHQYLVCCKLKHN